MKRSIKTSVIAALILAMSSMTFAPRPANAMIGAIAASPLLLTGLATLIGGTLLAGAGAGVLAIGGDESDLGSVTGGGMVGIGVIGEIVGLVLLDGSAGQTVVFKSLNQDEAMKLNISSQEMKAYNDNLDEINDVREAVSSDLAANSNATVQDSQADWAKFGAALDQNAFSAAQKVAAGAVQK